MKRGKGLRLLAGVSSGVLVLAAQSAHAQNRPAPNVVENDNTIIVTAQKRAENIQDVPMAVTALTSKALDEQKIEGGPDLLKGVPNVSFTKTNFTSYNIQIRGIGTQAIAASTDPGVAITYNYQTLLVNRLFEQEFFDMDRVEVLRGPQGTLYGRDATGGVVNLVPKKPVLDKFEGGLTGEVGNYNGRRGNAFINIPLGDLTALRVAGSFTDRDGYTYNSSTENRIDGRNLWSLRTSLRFKPADNFTADFTWERFHENDSRQRSGKQLCKKDPGLGGLTDADGNLLVAENSVLDAQTTQGCLPNSLYDKDSFGTVNGFALPFFRALFLLNNTVSNGPLIHTLGASPFIDLDSLAADPYDGLKQSTNLRQVESFIDPKYRAGNDILTAELNWNPSDAITLTSRTLYMRDRTYSTQDYNRYNSNPIFALSPDDYYGSSRESTAKFLTPGGFFTDPQLGTSNLMVAQDIAQGKASQFSQELQIASDFDGPFNFILGADYTKYKLKVDYYVFNNLITLVAQTYGFGGLSFGDYDDGFGNGGPDGIADCLQAAIYDACPYTDPNPLSKINGQGHNYFRSYNPYWLNSKSIHGEIYWTPSEKFKLTLGGRLTRDKKRFDYYPSETLVPGPSNGLNKPSLVNTDTPGIGYPILTPNPDNRGPTEDALAGLTSSYRKTFTVPTGRVIAQWTPAPGNMFYASYSHGFKAGGANPPPPGDFYPGTFGGVPLPSLTYKSENVEAFEIGSKNAFMGGALILNASAFYCSYKNYQVSQIQSRMAVNHNYDASIWGGELEALFQPSRNWRFNASLGYLDTKIGKGQAEIDPKNRTAGDPEWTVFQPWFQATDNCIVRKSRFDGVNPYGFALLDALTCDSIDDSIPDSDVRSGNPTPLGGNELPNSPHLTMNLGAQYTAYLGDWEVSGRGDFYRQSSSYYTVYNKPGDKLRGWTNLNLSLSVTRPEDKLKFEFYVKNVMKKTAITGGFDNSDDSGLTTNIFLTDPRLFGFKVSKGF